MRVMQPLRELGTPLADISQPMPFHHVQTAFDPLFPMGKLQSYWKAQNLAALPDEAIEVIAARANQRPSPLTLVVIFQMGGAINRVGPTDTAYAERSAPWMSSVDGNWEDRADNAKNIAWVRESFSQIAPYSTGHDVHELHGSGGRNCGCARIEGVRREHDASGDDKSEIRSGQCFPDQRQYHAGGSRVRRERVVGPGALGWGSGHCVLFTSPWNCDIGRDCRGCPRWSLRRA